MRLTVRARHRLKAVQNSYSSRLGERLCRLTCGKPPAFRSIRNVCPPLPEQAGRLSLPACSGVIILVVHGKAEPFRKSGGKAAVRVDVNERDLDEPEAVLGS